MNISSVLHRAARIYPDFVLGTGSEAFTNTLKNTVKNRAKDTGYFESVWKGIKEGGIAAENHNKQVTKLHGGFFQSFWHDLKTTPNKIAQGWRAGTRLADKAGKNSISKFWTQLKGSGNGLLKRMPVIGSLLVIGFELPNIIRATKDEGIFSGLVETTKSGLRLGAGMTCAAIGQALIPIPLVGGLAGWIIGDSLMGLFTGKSYTEKKEANQKLLSASANADSTYEQALKQYQALQAQNQNVSFGQASIPQATLTPQQVMALGAQLNSGYGLTNTMNQDFMKLTSGMTRGVNYLG